VATRAFGAQCKNPRWVFIRQKAFPAFMQAQILGFDIVQSRAIYAFFIKLKTQWLNQMELATSIGGEADNISGIRGDFWLKKNYVQHLAFCTFMVYVLC